MNHSNGVEPDNLRRVLAQLQDVRREGDGWKARCPAHDDRNPSLGVDVGEDGRVLLHCFGGCSFDSVLSVLGLSAADLAPSNVAAMKPTKGKAPRRMVAAYDYRDESGALLFQVVRFDPKDFRQRRPDPSKPDDWDWKVKGTRQVLYRLPELLGADTGQPVFVVEGEKDADRLAGFGLTATTCPGGAGKWRDDYREWLRGRRVVIVPDNDEKGRSHGQAVARSVAPVAAVVKVLELSGLPQKGDVSDWLDAGGNVAELPAMAEAAGAWSPAIGQGQASGPATVRMVDVTPQPLRWLWPGRIPRGKLTLIVGDPGTGKSLMVADMAARVSTGKSWPDAPEWQPTAGDVLLVSLEDDPADTIRPRLDAAGADLARIRAMAEVFSLERDLDHLERWMREAADPQLLVIDPISACLGNVDSHKNADVRRALAPLSLLAGRFGVAVVAVHHLNKMPNGPALYRAAGSLAFTAAARAVFAVAADRRDKRRRLLLPVKHNLAEAATGLAYWIESDETRGVGRLIWDARPIDMNADDALAALSPEDEEKRREREEAKTWLKDTLAAGPVSTKDLQTQAKEGGHAWRTIRRAADELDVRKCKRTNGGETKWYWSLPDESLPLFDALDAPEVVDVGAGELVQSGQVVHVANFGSWPTSMEEA